MVVWEGWDAMTKIMGFGSRPICLVSTFLLANCVTLQGHTIFVFLSSCVYWPESVLTLLGLDEGTCIITDINLASN